MIPFAFDYPFVFKKSKAERILFEGQYCILTKKHSGNYWHFTYSCLDIIWLLEQAGFEGKYVIPNKKFCSEILQLIGVSPERIVTLRNFEHNKIYVFEEVFYVTIGKGQEKYGTPVLLEAAEFIKNKLPLDSSLPKRIYVKRIGKRKLLGADNLLAEYGFTTMVPEHYSVREQMALFYNADIVFCVHGANSTNCLYMRKNTVFIEAFSSYWINRCNLYTVASAEVHYLPVSTLETVWTNEDGISRDFTIPEVLLRMTIHNAILINEAKLGSFIAE
jgi:capsular polysaccharide biosynthesis protein